MLSDGMQTLVYGSRASVNRPTFKPSKLRLCTTQKPGWTGLSFHCRTLQNVTFEAHGPENAYEKGRVQLNITTGDVVSVLNNSVSKQSPDVSSQS